MRDKGMEDIAMENTEDKVLARTRLFHLYKLTLSCYL